jgi:hypothetical protein
MFFHSLKIALLVPIAVYIDHKQHAYESAADVLTGDGSNGNTRADTASKEKEEKV